MYLVADVGSFEPVQPAKVRSTTHWVFDQAAGIEKQAVDAMTALHARREQVYAGRGMPMLSRSARRRRCRSLSSMRR